MSQNTLMLNNSINCAFLYRPFSAFAFDEIKNSSAKTVSIITYGSPSSLIVTLKKMRELFPKLKKAEVVIGLGYSKDDYKEKVAVENKENKENKSDEKKIVTIKRNFVNSLNGVVKELSLNYWSEVDLKLTLHNHCHIKYIQAESDCFTGSQNFSGTIVKSGIGAKYCKNELIVKVNEPKPILNQLTKEILQYLYAHEDEYITLDKEMLILDKASPSDIFEKLKDKRKSKATRDKYDEISDQIEEEYFSEIIWLEEQEKKLIRDEEKNLALPQFGIYKRINHLLDSELYKMESIRAITDEIEENFEISCFSEKLDEIESVIEDFISDNIDDLINVDNIDGTAALSEEIVPLIVNLVETNQRKLFSDYLFGIKESLLESIIDILKSFGFDDSNNFIQSNIDSIVSEWIENSPGTLPDSISAVFHNPDLLYQKAQNYIEHNICPSELASYSPKFFSNVIRKVGNDLEVLCGEVLCFPTS